MKIIRFITLPPSHTLDFHPDSALLLPGRPMFYPDFGGEWVALPMLAVRLNRLGKSVDRKFASRYYDALSPAIMIRPADPSGLSEGELSGMDCTITHGDWLAPSELTVDKTISFNGQEISVPYSAEDIDQAVSAASRLTTIKMGDIILLPLGRPLPLASRTHFIVSFVDGCEIMNVKVV